MNSPRPRAVLFDAYGTLFDPYSVGALAEHHLPGRGEQLAAVWRDKQIEYTRLVSMSGSGGEHYRSFHEVTRAGLRFAAARIGAVLTPAVEADLMNEYLRLESFPDAREVLADLQARGIPAGILSNGDPDMLAAAVDHAGLGDLVDPVLSAHEVRRFKTDSAVYALGPRALDLPAGRILFVSSNGWDAVGATWFGYITLWVNRSGQPSEQLGTEPTRTGTGLRDVLGFF
jgi:2-haloacid dehalogenase